MVVLGGVALRVALMYAAESLTPGELRSALGICQALRDGGHEPIVFSAMPASLPFFETIAYDPALIAPWTAGWQRNWRLPAGLRLQVGRQPVDVLICCGTSGDVPIARLALGYGSGPPILTWLDDLSQGDGQFAQYADLHLAPSLGHARRLQSLPPPPRPMALAPRPVPLLAETSPPQKGVRLLYVGPADSSGGLPLMLKALAALPSEWSLSVASSTQPDAQVQKLAAAAGNRRARFLPAAPDPWSDPPPASLGVVLLDRPEETSAIAEAAARALPVAATVGVTGARDLLEGDTPLPAEPAALAAALQSLRRQGFLEIARRQRERAAAARRDAPARLSQALGYLPPHAKVGVRA